jgi:O-antigen ligase
VTQIQTWSGQRGARRRRGERRARISVGGLLLLFALLALGVFSVATASVGSAEPLVALGIIMVVALLPLPTELLIAVFIGSAIISTGHGINVGTFNALPGQLLVFPLAVRVFVLGQREARPAWGWPEVLLIAWLGLSFLTSYLHAIEVRDSMIAALQLTIGALSYGSVAVAIDSRRRLVFTSRVILLTGLVSALIGVLAVGAYLLGVHWLDAFLAAGEHGRPGAVSSLPKGLIVENNVFGSFSAATAVGFFALMRDHNPVFTRRIAAMGFWIGVIACVLSATRGAWIGLSVALIAFAIFRRVPPSRRKPIGFGSAALPTLIGIVAIFGLLYYTQTPDAPKGSTISSQPPLVVSASGLLDFETGTGAVRVSGWTTAIEEVQRESPWIGMGSNSFGQRHLTGDELHPEPANLGSIYIRAYYDTGIVGLFLFTAFLFGVLLPPRALRYATGDLAPVARAFLFSYLVFAIAFVATDATFQPWPWITLGAAKSATALALRQIREHAAVAATPSDRA